MNLSADDTATHHDVSRDVAQSSRANFSGQTFKDPSRALEPAADSPKTALRHRRHSPSFQGIDPLGERFSRKENRTWILSRRAFAAREPNNQTWSWRRDLNPRPSDYKSDALPAELRQPTKAAIGDTAPAALRKLNRRLGLQSEDSTPACLMTMPLARSCSTPRASCLPVPAPGAAPQDSNTCRMLSFGTKYDFSKHIE